jgi:hypothetical protein
MCGSVPRVTATRLPLRSSILLIAVSFLVTSAVHSIDVNRLDRIAVDLAEEGGGAGGEPKSIEPAFKNSSALLEPSVCTQRTPMPSLANSFSRSPRSLSTIETGL